MINKFINVAVYRILAQVNSFSIHQQREELMDTIHNSPKGKKYLGINLSKEVKGLYSENFKSEERERE